MTTAPLRPTKSLIALFLGISLIYLTFMKPGIWGFDGNDMLNVSISLVTEGNFTVPEDSGGKLGRGGNYYSIRYPLLSILATPFVAIGITIANQLGLPIRHLAGVMALSLPLLLTAGTACLVSLLALRLGATAKAAYLVAISFALGTFSLVYAREFFAEPLLGFLTIGAVYLILLERSRDLIIGTIMVALAIIAKPTGVVIGPVLGIYLWCKQRCWQTAVTPLLGTAVGTALYLGYNYLRFENLFSAGQDTSRLQDGGVILRFLGMFLSPGAGGGLIWYCAPVLLALVALPRLWKRLPLETLVILGVTAGYVGLHSFWRFSGWNWGPRFLFPIVPLLLAVVAILPRRWWKWLLVLSLLGFLINAPTLVSYYQRYYAEASDGGYLDRALALWGPLGDTPLVNAWGAAWRQIQASMTSDVRELLTQAGNPPDSGNLTSAQFLQIVAVWWWMLPAVGIPLWIAGLMATVLLVSGIALLVWGWRQLDTVEVVQTHI
ncbi:MAG: hypothetical protein EA395_13400 [Phormidium sp. GEM2.Bin31]|nr:MAG: hypothetical protein EA395_13400 [Phormidium sp. GEM2.Bin31]